MQLNTEVIDFQTFMLGDAFFVPAIEMSTAYTIVGGIGVVLIGMTWLEKHGFISMNDNAVIFALILVAAFIIGKFIVSGTLFGLLM